MADLSAKVFILNGVDRSSTELLDESTPSAKYLFPTVESPSTMIMNMNDDTLGGFQKRAGCILQLPSPNTGFSSQMLGEFITNSGNDYWLMKSGPYLYVATPASTSWTLALTLSDSTHHMRMESNAGISILTNGYDPLMMYDGSYFYNIVSGCVSATLSSPLGATDNTIYVTPISFNPSSGINFPQNGFLKNGSEVIQYYGYNLNGSNQIISFNVQARSYGNSAAGGIGNTAISGASLPITYGSEPLTPKYVAIFAGRTYLSNVPTGPNYLTQSAARNELTDAYNFIVSSGEVDAASYSNFQIDAFQNGYQIINMITYAGNRLIVTQSASAWFIAPDQYGNPGAPYLLDGDYGTTSPESLIAAKSVAAWYNSESLQIFDGQGVTPASTPVNDIIQGVLPQNYYAVCSGYYNYKLWISLGTVNQSPIYARDANRSLSNLVMILNLKTNAYYFYSFPFLITSFSTMTDANGKRQLYFGDSKANVYVYNPDPSNPIYTDNGVDISDYIETKYMFQGEPSMLKDYKEITTISKGGSKATLQISLIDGKGETDWSEGIVLPSIISKQNLPSINSSYYGIAFKVSEVSASPFILKGFEIKYELRSAGGVSQ